MDSPSPFSRPSLSALEQRDDFVGRHIGPGATEIAAMLATIGASQPRQLIAQTVPAAIRLAAPLPLAEPRPESRRWPR
jgi:glycine dehydrogenase